LRMGLSQRRLVAKLGIDPGTLGNWERARHKPAKISHKIINHFLKWKGK
jgi:DNA-binding transcriptional regulator YiaG